MAYKGRGKSAKDSKYLRLTGLWESKKGGLFTGKIRVEDIDKLIEKCEEALKADAQLVCFLWENEVKDRKDPIFTLQVAVADEEDGKRRSSGSRRSRREEPEPEDDAEDSEDEPEEEPTKRPSRGKREEPPARGRKKAEKDW